MKREDGVPVGSKRETKRVWKRQLMNKKVARNVVSIMGVETSIKQVFVQGEFEREEVKKIIGRLKFCKTVGRK